MYQASASNSNFDFLDQICPIRVFPVENRKNELTIMNPQMTVSLLKLLISNGIASYIKAENSQC